MSSAAPPLALLAELTHRCPLQCPYCSNPLEMERSGVEMDTETWLRVFGQAAGMGALQVHFSGGEPTVRKDLEELVAGAGGHGLYTNLITSGVLLDEVRLDALVQAGLEHVQLSFQDGEVEGGDRIGGFEGAFERKIRAARMVREAGLPLTLNMVVHRQNLHNLERMIDLAVELDAHRVEIAHVQYYGWALKNRQLLISTREQLDEATAVVDGARERLQGVLVFDYVVPDYYARRPKSCMGGWGQQFFNVMPSGKVLPCHAALTIPGLEFWSVKDRPLQEIWEDSDAFRRFRGTEWMDEPCRSCERRGIDWGGCRCQAMAITGDASRTDPACELSSDHDLILSLAEADSRADPPPFVYRRLGGAG